MTFVFIPEKVFEIFYVLLRIPKFLKAKVQDMTTAHMASLRPLLGLTLADLRSVAVELGLPAFAAKQIAGWLYGERGTARSIEDMTNLSKAARAKLVEAGFYTGWREPLVVQRSVDGTAKYLFAAPSAGKTARVESVFIPSEDGSRGTLCVSCQVGCKMGCVFCMTGRQGFEGSLSAADILSQIISLPEFDRLTNIVFMGQGEPMDNLDAVLRATEILTNTEWGLGWSPRRITVSTVGLRKGLRRFLDESECHLAVSLHHPLPQERAALMPAEKAMGIREIVELLRGYDFAHQRRLSFEYIVFDGVNSTTAHADALIRLLRGLDCRINLIRFHDIPRSPLKGVSQEEMLRLRDYLTGHGLFTTVRASRGQDIWAACGLLSTKEKQTVAEQPPTQ